MHQRISLVQKTHFRILFLSIVLSFCAPSTVYCAEEPTTVRFAVIGDFGNDDKNEEGVVRLVKSWNPEFIITVGDNNYPEGEPNTIDLNIGKYFHEYIKNYKGSFGVGSSTERFFPTLGNHDWDCGMCQTLPKPYLDYFSLKDSQRYYDFIRGPVHFFALDSDPREPDGNTATSTQAKWLKQKLQTSLSPFKIAYFHHAPYSSGPHGNTKEMQWPFKQWGIHAVISGHDHIYERYDIQGVPYFVNGVGGRPITGIGTRKLNCKKQFSGDYGAMLVNADKEKIQFEFYTKTKVKIDEVVIQLARTL